MKDAQLETKTCKAEEGIQVAARGKRKSTGSEAGDARSAAIAAVNGEGDDSHISSTIIQVSSTASLAPACCPRCRVSA